MPKVFSAVLLSLNLKGHFLQSLCPRTSCVPVTSGYFYIFFFYFCAVIFITVSNVSPSYSNSFSSIVIYTLVIVEAYRRNRVGKSHGLINCACDSTLCFNEIKIQLNGTWSRVRRAMSLYCQENMDIALIELDHKTITLQAWFRRKTCDE